MKRVCVLRLGHRPFRDKRVTTHVGLAARAFGADGMYLAAGDPKVAESIRDVAARWGGGFFVEDGVSWKRCVRDWKERGGCVVHLTMYGMPLQDSLEELRRIDRMLVVVGGPKVPGKVYHEADFNIAVTSQPHSEIAALAIVLHEVQGGEELKRSFEKSRLRILPSPRGKRVVES